MFIQVIVTTIIIIVEVHMDVLQYIPMMQTLF